jgi:hypothetical protein|tara:strand:+ start:187 stop:753 length:567 start_codon:yes stop_codon:yes gene_type:complete
MKGFVLAGLLSHLEKQYGEEYTDDLIISMNREVSGVYLSMADYPDDTLDILVQTAAKLLEIPRAMLGKILGIHLFAELLVINSAWVEHNDNGLDLLKSHDMALNALTMAAFPGFVPPSYMCTQINSDMMEITYRSIFMPADMAEGLIGAMLGHYKEHFSIEQKSAEQQVGFNRQFIVRRKIPRHLLSD